MQSEDFYLSEVEKSRAMAEMNERMNKKRKIEEVLYPAEIVEQLKNKDVQIKALENENARMLAELAEGRRLMAERQRLLAEMEQKSEDSGRRRNQLKRDISEQTWTLH